MSKVTIQPANDPPQRKPKCGDLFYNGDYGYTAVLSKTHKLGRYILVDISDGTQYGPSRETPNCALLNAAATTGWTFLGENTTISVTPQK